VTPVIGDRASQHPRVSLSQLCSWSWTLDQDLAFYERAGVSAIGACVVKLEATGWMLAAHRIADSGLRVTNLLGVAPLRPSDHAGWNDQRCHAWRALEAARVAGAECLILTAGPDPSGTWEQAAEAYRRSVEPIVTEAGRRGVAIAVEHANRRAGDTAFPSTLHDAVALARDLGVGVCVDVGACWEESGLRETIGTGVDTFRLVRVSDAVPDAAPDGTSDGRPPSRRLVPGDGTLPISELLGVVLDAGYRGVFEIEFTLPPGSDVDPGGECRRAVEQLGAILDSLGA
jgi:sugar phosphate isomerase/epimerase